MNSNTLTAVLAVVGLGVGGMICFLAPRLVAYRLETAPDYPSPTIVIPIVGPFIGQVGWLRPLFVQLGTGVVFALLARHYGASTKLAIAALYCTALIAVAYIDLGYRLVLNRLTYTGTPIAIALSVLWTSFSPYFHPLNALLGAVLGLLIFGVLQIIGRGALGTGDTKLATLIGAMVGFPNVLSTLLVGVVLGGLGAIFFLVVLRRGRKTYMAYAPYLALGTVLFLLTT